MTNKKISGSQLNQIKDVLECALQIENPHIVVEPVEEKGWVGNKKVSLRARIVSLNVPKENIDLALEKSKLLFRKCQRFGTCKLSHDESYQYVDFTDINLDSLRPDISSSERTRLQQVLDQILPRMEKIKKLFDRRIPIDDARLSSDLNTYNSEKRYDTKMHAIETILQTGGSLLRDIDYYSALQIHAWASQGGSRDALPFKASKGEFDNALQHFKDINPTEKPTSSRPHQHEPQIIQLFYGHCAYAASFFLDVAPEKWIAEDMKSAYIKDLIETIPTLITDNKKLLLKVSQEYLYQQAVKGLARSA